MKRARKRLFVRRASALIEIGYHTAYISSRMKSLPRTTSLLSLFFLLCTTAAVSALSLGASGLGEVRVEAGQGFGPKLQYGGGGSLDLRSPLLPWLDFGASLDLYDIAPSDISGGFDYRGFLGGDIALGVEAHTAPARWAGIGELAVGTGLGFAGVLAGYQYTTLYFFYPELTAKIFLDYVPVSLPAIDVRLSIPIGIQFRPDMDYSASAGVTLGFAYRLGGAK